MRRLGKMIASWVLTVALVAAMLPALSVEVRADSNITVAVDNNSTYKPTQIENGNFETKPYMEFIYGGKTYTRDNPYSERIPDIFNAGGQVKYNGVGKGWNTTETCYEGWFSDTGKNFFEWVCKSGSATYGVTPNGSACVEMNQTHPGTLYQDLKTYDGDVILWTLKHAKRTSGAAEQKMEVEIGKPTGTNPSGYGNDLKVEIVDDTKACYTENGVSGTNGYANITELSALNAKSTEWVTAKGVYIIPSGQTVTRFAFVSKTEGEGDALSFGNLLDDITFDTLIGHLDAKFQTDRSIKIWGYWGEVDSSKHLKIKIGNTVNDIDMSTISKASNHNFIITIPESKIGNATSVEVYHQDYECGKKTVKIALLKQNITVSNVTATYGDAPKSVSAKTDGGGTISYSVKSGSGDYIDVNSSTGQLTIKKVPTDGKAYVTVTASKTTRYDSATKDVTVTINKADVVLTAPAVVENLKYTGSEYELVTAGAATGGVLNYAFGNTTQATESYTTSIPKATAAGTYYVWYKVVGDANHNDTTPECVTVTVGKKSAGETGSNVTAAQVSGESLKYDGSAKTPTITVKDGDTTLTKDTDYTVKYVGTGSTTYAESATAPTAAGTYQAKITFTGNYEGTGEVSFTIGKGESSVTTAPTPVANLVYTGSDVALVSAGTVSGGNINYAIGTSATAVPTEGWSTDVPVKTDAGTYYVWYKVAGDANHNDTTPECVTVTVGQKSAAETGSGVTAAQASGESLKYDGNAKTPTITVKDGDTTLTKDTDYTVKYVGVSPTEYAESATAPVSAGSYKAVISFKGNYSGTGEVSFTIGKGESSVTTAPTPVANLVYTGSDVALVSAGTVSGGNLCYVLGTDATTAPAADVTWKTDVPVATGVGTYYVWYKVLGDDDHTGSEPVCIEAVIGKKDIVISGITAKNKSYDGTTAAELDYSGIDWTACGKLENDQLSVSATGTFADANAGKEKSVNISGLTLGGSDAGNYKLAANGQQTVATADITGKQPGEGSGMTVRAVSANNIVYDGTDKTPVMEVKDGDTALGAEDYSIKYQKQSGSTWNDVEAGDIIGAGIYRAVVTFTGNYSGEQNVVFIVNKIESTLTTAPEVKTGLKYTGDALQIIDSVGQANGGTILFKINNEGDYTAEPTITDAGTYNVYYYIKGDDNHEDWGPVTDPLSVTVARMDAPETIGDTQKPSGKSQEELIYSGEPIGLVNAPSADIPAGYTVKYSLNGTDWSTDIPTGTSAKAYAVKVKYVGDDNHTDFNIDDISVSISPESVEDAVITLDNYVRIYTGTALDVSVTGVKIGEKVLIPGTDYEVKSGNSGTEAQTYTLTIEGKGNYTGTATAEWSIEKSAMTVSVNNISVVYDGGSHGITVAPTVPSEGYTVTYKGETGDYDLTESPAITDAGTLTVDYKITAANYEDHTGSATITVTKRPVKVSGITASDKVYDGNVSATIDTANAAFEGLVAGDELTVSATGTFADANVSTDIEGNAVEKTVNISDMVLGGASKENYVPATEGQQTEASATITKKAVTVTANDQTVDLNGAIIGTTGYAALSEAVTGHTLSGITLTSSSTAEYTLSGTITPSGAAIADADGVDVTSNYAISYGDGVLRVNKGASSITTAPVANELTYNGSEQELISAGVVEGGTISYAVTDANETAAPDAAAYSTNIPVAKNAGSYKVYYKVTGDENHTDIDVLEAITVTIAQKEIGLSWNGTEFTYNGSSICPTAAATGLAEGDICNVTVTGSGTNAGSYTATAASIDNDNYKLPSANTISYTINPAQMTVTAEGYSGTEDGQDHSITVTVTEPSDAAVTYSNAENGTYTSEKPSFMEPGSYTVYYIVARDNYVQVSGSETVVINPTAPEAGEGYSLDYKAETITLEEGYQIRKETESDETWKGSASSPLTMEPGTVYEIRKIINSNGILVGSDTVSFAVTSRPDKPAEDEISVTDETVYGIKDGSISGVTGDMEYRYNPSVNATSTDEGWSEWVNGSGSDISELAPGSYEIRIKATESAPCSEALSKKLAAGAYAIMGVVIKYDDETPYANGTVNIINENGNKLKPEGSEEYKTDDNGVLEASNLPYGYYTVSVTGNSEHGGKSVTGTVEITDVNMSINISIPTDEDSNQSKLVLDGVGSNDTGIHNVMADVDDIAKNLDQDNSVITMNVVEKPASDNYEGKSAINDLVKFIYGEAANSAVLDVTITKTTGTEEEKIKDTPNVMEVIIPYDFTGRNDLRVFRYHVDGNEEGKASQFRRLNARLTGGYLDGTCYVDYKNGYIYIYTSKFSTYQITSVGHEVKYTVSFDSKGGSAVESQSIASGSTVVKPVDPVRKGYKFMGWWYDDEGTAKEWNFDSYTVVDNTQLYAKWMESDEEMGDVLPEDYEEGLSQSDGKDVPNGLWIAGIKDVDYTGKAIKQTYRVYDYKTLLVEKKDYTASWRNNTKAYNIAEKETGFNAKKAPGLKITGKGNYNKVEVAYFKIIPPVISGEDFSADDIALKYNKSNQNIRPKLYWKDKALANNRDYTVSIYASKDTEHKTLLKKVKDAGTYDVVLKGKGNFTGERTIEAVVTANNKLVSKLSIGRVNKAEYTGAAIKPKPVVKDGRTVLTEGKDYTLEYERNTEVGTAFVIIKGRTDGGYEGERRISFKITGTPISKAVVEGIPGKLQYTGKEITCDDTLKLKNKSTGKYLIKGTDYEVSYAKNVSAGGATVLITGKGGYTGTISKSFTITPYDISYAKDTQGRIKVKVDYNENKEVSYLKGVAKPKVTVIFTVAANDDRVLKEGVDYTLSYKNNTKVSTKNLASVTVKGKGCFGNSRIMEYKIVSKDLTKGGVKVVANDKSYKRSGKVYMTRISLVDTDGKKLGGSDYNSKSIKYTYTADTVVEIKNNYIYDKATRKAGVEVSKEDIIPAGTVIKVTVQAKGGSGYTGEVSGTYRITRAAIMNATSVKIPDQIYTGKEIVFGPEVMTVKIGRVVLVPYDENTGEGDFIITGFQNNIKKGTAKVTIQGMNNYGGTKTANFKIKQKGFIWWWR